MDTENRYASKGVAGTALGLGAGALGVEPLRGRRECKDRRIGNRSQAP